MALLLLCVAVVVAWPSVRRRLLARHGSIFDCELNLGAASEPDWQLGLARCAGDDLEWFPRPGIGFRPAHTLSRAASGIRAQTRTNDPDGLNGQRIVRLETSGGGESTVWELSMDTEALTALLAWLEAAPPSVGRFRS
ncbi:DUF2550 family protein [Granulicoccus sp. GXG6511]|uniref:DUF2550 family protein n=1 Tax=Granulicoccus sp. GXG6511 TaxID=3381351 RepID=UPI003D7D4565